MTAYQPLFTETMLEQAFENIPSSVGDQIP